MIFQLFGHSMNECFNGLIFQLFGQSMNECFIYFL